MGYGALINLDFNWFELLIWLDFQKTWVSLYFIRGSEIQNQQKNVFYTTDEKLRGS